MYIPSKRCLTDLHFDSRQTLNVRIVGQLLILKQQKEKGKKKNRRKTPQIQVAQIRSKNKIIYQV